MAYRGRGRGRGRGQLSFRGAKQLPFELFPEVPNLGNASGVTARITLAARHLKLQKYWNSSPYYLGEESDVLKKTKGMDIERFSDRNLERVKSKQPLAHFIRMDPAYVPAELAKGGREVRRAAKRVRWNPEADMQKLDLLEKLDQKSKGGDEKKKDGDDEDEEQEEKIEEEEEEFSDDGDYNQMRPCIEGVTWWSSFCLPLEFFFTEMEFFNHCCWTSRKLIGLVNEQQLLNFGQSRKNIFLLSFIQVPLLGISTDQQARSMYMFRLKMHLDLLFKGTTSMGMRCLDVLLLFPVL
ncbi:putative serine/threonine-protein kinase-like [Capsicum annuum]|nr:putative serine/threonine-protein kinase-like [Capsicum annuum]